VFELGSHLNVDLQRTPGYVVVDREGHVVGRVEGTIASIAPDLPHALSVRTGFFGYRRRVVPVEMIEVIDPSSRVIGLRLAWNEIWSVS
jgi:hypothetical protein